jgi:hypothetical protein
MCHKVTKNGNLSIEKIVMKLRNRSLGTNELLNSISKKLNVNNVLHDKQRGCKMNS